MKKVIIKNSILIFAVSLLFASCKVDLKTEPEKHYYKTTEIPIIVRDFVPWGIEDPSLQQYKHYDFDNINKAGVKTNHVLDTLDKDKKPVLNDAYPPEEMSLKSSESFAQWFRTIKGVNKEIKTSLEVRFDGSRWEFYAPVFFPIDNLGFGNDEGDHNFNFTVESTFYLLYRENTPITISCKSDDDLWLFVNGKLLIDLGGRHGVETKQITFDAKDYKAQPGDYIEIKLFKADRGVSGSIMGFSVSQDIYILK
ncbi:MAG: fibro-slime domain-containing protein [Treponema sp.]|nr:fibro-slime domain-containing protein [Treponema sp.]